MNALRFFVTAILFLALQLSTTLTPVADAKDKPDPQMPDARYSTSSPIPDYIRQAGKSIADRMRVIHPSALPAEIACERIQVGMRMGYKPNVQRLAGGELVMLNFHTHGETQGASDGSMMEHMVIHRSNDNGRTWTSKHVQGVYGREPYLSVYSYYHVDDDIAQLLKSDQFKQKNVYNYYRNRALGYNPQWVGGCSEQNFLHAGDRLQRHMFLGCCQLLNLCGPVTEVTKWKFPK